MRAPGPSRRARRPSGRPPPPRSAATRAARALAPRRRRRRARPPARGAWSAGRRPPAGNAGTGPMRLRGRARCRPETPADRRNPGDCRPTRRASVPAASAPPAASGTALGDLPPPLLRRCLRLQARRDIVGRLPDGRDLDRILVGDAHARAVLELLDERDQIERVGLEVLLEARVVLDA